MTTLLNNNDDELLDWSIGKRIVKDDKLYKKALEAAVGCCEDAARSIGPNRPLGKDEDGSHSANTVVGVVGERGSGKTSFLHTLADKLPDSCYVLDVVDPSSFQSGMSALELFLARIYSSYIETSQKRHAAASCYEPAKLHNLFRKISKSLSSLRVNKSVYNSDNPSMEVLGHIVDLLGVGNDLQNLCQEFLAYVNIDGDMPRKECIVMLIDDVDMADNLCVYQIMEDVRKFLSGRIVVVLAYREKQLMDSILERKIRENEGLLEQQFVTNNELQFQIEDLIEKAVPLDRTIRLYSQKDLLDKHLLDVLAALNSDAKVLRGKLVDSYSDSCGFDENVTVREWIDAVLYAKTLLHVTPVQKQEETVFVWPRNLRELVSLAHVLQSEMAVPDSELGLSERFEQYEKNLSRYRDFFLGRLNEALDPMLFELLDRWLCANNEAKNYVAYAGIYDLIIDSLHSNDSDNRTLDKSRDKLNISQSERQMLGELLDANLVRSENVTIGDVSSVLNKFILLNHGSASRIHLGYSLKLLYSMEALGYLLQAFQKHCGGVSVSDNLPAQKYLDLINSCVIAPEKAASPLSHEMLFLSMPARWSKVLGDSRGVTKMLDRSTARRVMALLGCTTFELPNATRQSKPTLYQSSRPLREGNGVGSVYAESENRPMFTMNRIDLRQLNAESVEEKERREDEGLPSAGLPNASSPQSPSLYPVCILNILGKQAYLSYALSEVVKTLRSCEALAEGAYLFYSMFDLDIFAAMGLSARQSGKRVFSDQIRRINTALAYSQIVKLPNDARASLYSSDDTLMRVDLSYERELLRRLHTPFVCSAHYRLLGNAKNASPLSFAEATNAFNASCELESLSRWLSDPLLDLISTGGKEEIGNYLDAFTQELDYAGYENIAMEVRQISDRLHKPNTRPAQSERMRINRIIRAYAYQANRAFDKC